MHIHIVCYANVFRSRLAEAYMKSQLSKAGIGGVEVSSSGTHAENNSHGAISWYTARILLYSNLVKFSKNVWTQTSEDQLSSADAIIFIHESVFEEGKRWLDNDGTNYQVWDIGDVSTTEIREDSRDQDDADLRVIHLSEDLFRQIKHKVDDLIEEVTPLVG